MKNENSEEDVNYKILEVPPHYDYPLVWLLSDVHYGHKKCAEDEFKYNLKWGYSHKNVYVIDLGDNIESSIVGSPGLFDQKKFPRDQLYEMVDMLKPFANEGRLISMQAGNHEDRISVNTSIDITEFMSKLLGVKYMGYGALHYLRAKKKYSNDYQDYSFYTTHGASSAWYPHTKIAACIRLRGIANADLYAMGHVHALMSQKTFEYEIDHTTGRNKKITKYFVLTGSYLKYWNSYAQKRGYSAAGDIGSPKVKLHIDTHKISVSL